MKKLLFLLVVTSLFNSNLLAADKNFQAIYNFDRVIKNKIKDSGDEQIDGVLYGPYTPSEGKKGLCISFNGVDNGINFPAFFSGAQDQLSMWICPAANPEDPITDRFNARLDGNQLDFYYGYLRAIKDNDGKVDWGVLKGKKLFVSRLSKKQYVFACDSPSSGFRMQAWLSPVDGTLRLRYASPNYNGRLQMRHLKSKSKVWVKGLWTKIELRINQKEKNMALYINEVKEDQTSFYTAVARGPYKFSLGCSRQLGLPFYGKIDEFEVKSDVSTKNWIFPEGNFEYMRKNKGAAIDLSFPFQPLALDPVQDKTLGVKEGDSIVQKFVISSPGRGMLTRVYFPYYKKNFSLSFKAKSAKPGKLKLLISGSANPKLASKEQSIDTTNSFKTYTFDDIFAGYRTKYIIITFETAGTYWLDDICVY